MLAASAGARTPAHGGNPAFHHNGFLVPAPGRPICAPPAAQEARYTGPGGAVLACLEWQIDLPGGDFSNQPALRCNPRFLVLGPKTRFVETADPVQRVTTISTEPARLIAGFVSLPQRFRTRAYAVIRNSGFVQRHGSSSLSLAIVFTMWYAHKFRKHRESSPVFSSGKELQLTVASSKGHHPGFSVSDRTILATFIVTLAMIS
jgi:hypothetical protein